MSALDELRANLSAFKVLVGRVVYAGGRLRVPADVEIASVALIKLVGSVVHFRSAADDADVDIQAKLATLTDKLQTNTILPRTGSVLTLGEAGQRVRVPNVTDQTGIGDRDLYRYQAGNRLEARVAFTEGAGVVPKTLNMTTLLAAYDGSEDGFRNVQSSLGRVAQTFTPAYDSQIGAVVVKMRRVGAATDSARLEILAVGGDGKPTGTPLATSQAIEGTELALTTTRVAFRFSSPVSRSAGQATAFALTRTGVADTIKYYQLAVDNTSPAYEGGQIATAVGDTWTLREEDASFFEVWSPTTGGASGGGGGAPTDELVKVSSDDTTPGYLLAKLAAGTGIVITEVGGGADEDAQIAHAQVGSGDLHTEYRKKVDDIGAIEFVIDGGGSAITTGIKGDLWVPYACTVKAWRLLADQAGAIVVDIWNKAGGAANYPPTNGEAMPGAGKEPTIAASDDYAEDDDVTDWTSTAIAAGSTLRFNVDSCATITRCTIAFKVAKT